MLVTYACTSSTVLFACCSFSSRHNMASEDTAAVVKVLLNRAVFSHIQLVGQNPDSVPLAAPPAGAAAAGQGRNPRSKCTGWPHSLPTAQSESPSYMLMKARDPWETGT